MSFSYLSKFNGLANDLNAIKVSNFPVLSLFAKYIVWRVPFELLSNDHGFECKNNLKLLVEPRRSTGKAKAVGLNPIKASIWFTVCPLQLFVYPSRIIVRAKGMCLIPIEASTCSRLQQKKSIY